MIWLTNRKNIHKYSPLSQTQINQLILYKGRKNRKNTNVTPKFTFTIGFIYEREKTLQNPVRKLNTIAGDRTI